MSTAGRSSRRFLLLDDLPVSDGTDDLLGTGTVASSLADLIYGSRSHTPFALAIDGQWGAGKSTLMKQLSAGLQTRTDMEVVWFNAWTATGGGALTGMLETVLNSLDRNVVRRSLRRLNSNGFVAGALRIGVGMAAGFFRVDRALDQLWERMAVDASARQQVRRLLEEAMTTWTDGRDGTPRRTITIFVDDLDRCDHRTALEIFEAMKLYLDLPGIAFVLGCDLSVLTRLALPGADEPAQVRSYLEKIIQVHYRIPRPAEAQVHSMIIGYANRSRTDSLLTDDMVALIGRQTVGNPRRVKRLINSFVAEYDLDQDWHEIGAEGLMKVVILQHLYPDFYHDVLAGKDDTAGDVLNYRLTRDWLRRAAALPPQQREAAHRLLTHHDVALPTSLDDHSYDAGDCARANAQLAERVPALWPALIDNDDLLDLLRSFGDQAERGHLQSRLRRRPLSTAPTTLSGRGKEPRLDGIRLLWVDDNPAGNEALINTITARGAQVRTAVSGEQARALLPNFNPNLLLSDVGRGGAEVGFTDLVALRKDGYAGPALFYTSHFSTTLNEKAIAAGAVGVTASPTTVMEWLERHSANAATSPG
ncbi:P-loop NTPase fold protein [Micromonospora parathelypteridis]|uniref:P-loop NTPase fold protein n=1 Tax=Micromonospora parathelypteridis TaxID=1839617 RepID=UPI00161A05C4|nr:P-loop NTPase fold protein [Micromonospora parathelypteridis]GGO27715.1 hypothetical protein GCM10011576_52580 [Micromonospora parathelypteridis]